MKNWKVPFNGFDTHKVIVLSIFLSMPNNRMPGFSKIDLYIIKNMRMNFFKLKIICVFVFLCAIGFSGKAQQKTVTEKKQEITFLVFSSANNTWGYDILVDKKLTIHQPNIPGVAGESGFKTKVDAENVAKLVVGKIKKGEMPPSITLEEMKKIKAI
jgi:hypothetical protein